MSNQTFEMVVVESKKITPNVLHLGFRLKNDEAFSFIPGQFITIHFNYQDKSYKRSYSIATIPNENNLIEIAASYFPGGPGTEYLFHLKPGDVVEASGPFGKLTLRDEQIHRYVLVATGTGVTPYRAMLPELEKRLAAKQIQQVVVLLGVQTRDELLYGKDFLNLAEKNKQFEFHAHYSRQFPEQPEHYEYHGYVQTAFEKLNLNPQQDIFYLCGNPKMIDEAFLQLKELGFETNQVRREKYVSSPSR